MASALFRWWGRPLPSASLSLSQGSMASAGSLPCGGLVRFSRRAPVEQVSPNSPLRPVGGVTLSLSLSLYNIVISLYIIYIYIFSSWIKGVTRPRGRCMSYGHDLARELLAVGFNLDKRAQAIGVSRDWVAVARRMGTSGAESWRRARAAVWTVRAGHHQAWERGAALYECQCQ